MANNKENPMNGGAQENKVQSVGYQCEQCPKAYKNKKDLLRHMKASHSGVTFPCCTCGKEFNVLTNRTRHEKTCNPAVKAFDCDICGKRCATKGGLRRHQEVHQGPSKPAAAAKPPTKKAGVKRKNQEPGASGVPKKQRTSPAELRCRRCPETFENRRELYVHGMRHHYQVGGGLQPVPWEDNSAPWENEDGSINEAMREVYEVNEPLILQEHRFGPIQSTYNFPIANDVTLAQLLRFAREIYEREQQAFRLNLVFGVILQNRDTGLYRYFTPFSNNAVLERPIYISRRTDLKRLLLNLRRLDILDEILRNRPDTKWFPVLLTNVQFHITSSNYPVGQGDLPEYITKKQSIYPLIKNQQTGKFYNDNLCLFRCLAVHSGNSIKNIEAPTKEFFRRWKDHKICEEPFHGVSMEEFPQFECLFQIDLEVYSLTEDEEARSVYKSLGRFGNSMYLNLYNNHISYIKDFTRYANKFQCKTCERHFNHAGHLDRHQKICTNKTKYVYPGGFHRPAESIFEKLEQFNIHVPKDQRTFKWFICFDFESMLQSNNEKPTQFLEWTQKHVSISVSICSNVEKHTDPFCIVNPNQEQLVQSMIESMTTIADRIKELSEKKWGWVLEEINKRINKGNKMNLKSTQLIDTDSEEEYEENDEVDKNGEDDEDGDEAECKRLHKLYGQMEGYMMQVPVLAFNSAKYDLNLIKQTLARLLNMHDKDGTFVVKKNNAYTCISSQQLKFLDMSQFLDPGSYGQFLKAYRVEETKGYFPYEWLDDVAKLDETTLPPHEAFYSKLKNANISVEEYEVCQRVWTKHNMQTFRDFLVWYNNLDVGPFVTAVERFQQFYFDKGVDVFKSAISVPGIARQLLFRSAKEQRANFALFDRNNADLYHTIKQNIIGGPSIIFNRHHKSGITRIRGGKICQKICGFDANALYLQAIGEEIPVGSYIRRVASTGFKPELRDKFMAAFYWMDWLMYQKKIQIVHQQNHGYEVRVGKYPVDGYQKSANAAEKPTCYQFHGCFWHGHQCNVTKNVKDPKWLATREEKFEKTKKITEYLKRKRCNVVEMWECQFRNYCRLNPEIYDFINSMRPGFFRKNKGKKINEEDILQGVVRGELFGMVEVNIQVPDRWPSHFQHPNLTPYEYFEEMSPLFCTTDVPYEAFGSHMQDHVEKHNLTKAPRRLLVGGMRAKQILLATPLLKWYLNHGMIVTKIHQLVEFQSQRCFQKFVEEVSEARRAGDRDPNTSIIAETMKVIGNSSFGGTIMDKTKHREIQYVQGENETCLKVNEPRFRKLECLDMKEQYYEIEMAKSKIKLDLPIQLGYFILQYAKLRMLEFYYDFMDVYVDRSDFEYCEMDTDSAYMAISGSRLEDVIKPHMKDKYLQGLKGFCSGNTKEITKVEVDSEHHWFPRTCCERDAKYDKRTPGLFKLEYEGEEMIGLCSKTYIVRKTKVVKSSSTRFVSNNLLRKAKGLKPKRLQLNTRSTQEYKFSSKGINKRNVSAPMSIFRQVLKTGKARSGVNRGFRARNNTIFTYTQERRGFSYFYCKRKVANDGIHTSPLDITLCSIPSTEDKKEDESEQEVIDALSGLLDEQ